ncbi:hypothetical protein AKJ57_05680 [candidate division MSBL1 archaeon SCGC-AAA259A05]|uniref:GIY-YIG domain-containing protein n=1 Tax=candidate division MSBL1 archaeon SCGC-AAA259A05 TaxID=1698259 RepID=A0A133U4T5_9EURY|nr:hypothetical protein AKJ57_05680 [candidate division MSBL1 archaeon SCGC-AAA259A05]
MKLIDLSEISDFPECAGVYCIFDLDETPAYGGQTSNLKGRMKQHFIRQDSSVVSYGKLDVWDIYYVLWWETDRIDKAEKELISFFQPYLNLEDYRQIDPGDMDIINPENPSGKLRIISENESRFRRSAYNRAKQKLEHVSRMIDKIKFAGHTEETRKTVYEHMRILKRNLDKFLENK